MVETDELPEVCRLESPISGTSREAKLEEKNCGFLKEAAGWKVLLVTKPTAMTSISWKSNLNGSAGVVKVFAGGLRRPRGRLSEKPHARRPVKSGRS